MRVTSSSPATPPGLGGVIVIEVTVTIQNRLKYIYTSIYDYTLLHHYYVSTLSLIVTINGIYLNLRVGYGGNLEIIERGSLFSFKPHPPRHFRA